MNRAFEFVQNHPWLIAAATLLAIAAATIEWRYRKGASGAVGPVDAVRLINSGALVVDVRAADAYAAGHIIDARHIPAADLLGQADSLKKYREKPVIVCCDSGAASAGAANALKAQGFAKVVNLRGGLQAWKTENLPVVTATANANAHTRSGKHKGAHK